MKKKIILTIAFLISLLPMLLNQYGGMKGVQEISGLINLFNPIGIISVLLFIIGVWVSLKNKKINKTSKKYDILMIVWGLSLGVIELWLIHLGFFDRINIPFIKAPYAKNLLILAIVSLCFRVITYFIQQPYKQKLENKNKIVRNRHLALICSIISITIMFFILWSVEMSRETDGSLFSIIILTIEFVIVQLPFLLPIF